MDIPLTQSTRQTYSTRPHAPRPSRPSNNTLRRGGEKQDLVGISLGCHLGQPACTRHGMVILAISRFRALCPWPRLQIAWLFDVCILPPPATACRFPFFQNMHDEDPAACRLCMLLQVARLWWPDLRPDLSFHPACRACFEVVGVVALFWGFLVLTWP